MPQIANQDYNAIRPVVGTSIQTDAAALAEIAGHIERGTVFDCILSGRIFSSDRPRWLARITQMEYSLNEDKTLRNATIVFSRSDVLYKTLDLSYPRTVYDVFAKVQSQSGLDSYAFGSIENVLIVMETEAPVAVDGRYVILRLNDDDEIEGWNYGDVIPDNVTYYSITEKDADTLIGITI